MSVAPSTTIEVSHKGAVSTADIDRAVDKVREVADRTREPAHHIEVRLSMAANPAHERPAMAEATIDLHGRMVRAHVGAETVNEAVDGLADRLRRRLRRNEDRLRHTSERHRTGDSGEGEWRHGDLPSIHPAWTELPEQARELVRQKTFAMEPMTLDEAAFDVEQLDHSFYLFVEIESGMDACMLRGRDGGFTVLFTDHDAAPSLDGIAADVRIGDTSVPTFGVGDAQEHLDATGDASVFFLAEDAGRGHVMYRRFDGHYGLVAPS